MFIYQEFKHFKEVWRVEGRVCSECLTSVRVEAAFKNVRERINWNLLWKQKTKSQKLNISTQSSNASSRTIYTWERPSPQKDTSLLLLWPKSDGQEQNVSSSGMPKTVMKTSSSRMRNFSPPRSSTTTSTTRFMLKSPLWCGLSGQEAITLPTSWFTGVTHKGVTLLHFCEQGVKAGYRVYHEEMLHGVVKQLNTTVFSGQK